MGLHIIITTKKSPWRLFFYVILAVQKGILGKFADWNGFCSLMQRQS
jgi:hypothetical protein